jgi:DNA polymerase-1
MQKKLFLLDGHALVYRAHYAFMTRPLMNSKGQNVSAISGFTRSLLEVIRKEQPTHLAVSFDLPTPTFRHIEYTEYKANRDAQPEDITFAIPNIIEILRGMRIPIVTAEGYEADDVIGTLAKQAEREGFQVFMMTPDKDYAQLVSPNIFLYKPAKGGNDAEVWGEKEVLENWQIKRVEQVIDMLGLQGDSVDNIPGIKGIGPKTAATLLAQFNTLENIIANVEQLKGKSQETIRQNANVGILSKRLATIALDVPIQFHEASYRLTPKEDFDQELLANILKELEFKTLTKDLLTPKKEVIAVEKKSENPENPENDAPQQQLDLFGEAVTTPSVAAPTYSRMVDKNISNTPHTYYLVETPEQRADLIQLLANNQLISFDTETTGIDANQAELVGLSFSVKAHEGFYVPVPKEQNEAKQLVNEFKTVLENPNIKKIGQNIKYDLILLKWYGIEAKGVYFDTMLAHYLIEPELRHNMNYMAETMLGYAPVSIETLIGKGKNQLSMRDIAVEKVKDYAAEDADVTFQLFEVLDNEINKNDVRKLLEEIEMPLVQVLTDLEFEGIRIDAHFLANYAKDLDKEIKEIEQKIYEAAGKTFNASSPKQVGEVLFDHLKIPYRWKKSSKSEQYSTDEEKLTELSYEYPIAGLILDYRSVTKLQNTYVEALPRMINPRTGRVHSSFNQALAATGRLSSNNPNLQNIPIRTQQGARVREAFVPRDANHVLLSADYSQIELRLIAEIAHENAMLEAFTQNVDIHLATAARVYDTPLSSVTAEQRRNAKTVNFSIIYGAGAQNLSQQLKISRSEAKKLIDQYFLQYAGLKNYMQTVVDDARKNGYVSTLLGRRRYLRDIDSRNALARSNAERVAINTPIQGSAADMIKIAMINIHKTLKEKGLKTKMILQVHDELVFDVPKSELDIVKPLIAHCMKTAIPNLKVPIEVGMGVGDNWLEAH